MRKLRSLHALRHWFSRSFNVRKSIQAKMFLALSGVVLISLALFGMLMYRSFSDNLKDNTKQVVLDSLHHADETVNVFFDDIDHISSVIVTNKPNVIDELQSPNFEISYDWFLENKQSEEFLQSLMAFKSYTKRIAIVGMNGKIIYTGSPYLDKSFVNGKLVSTIAANEGACFPFPGHAKLWLYCENKVLD